MKTFQKIVSLTLLLNIVFSTVGLSRTAHYCGDKLSSLTYFTKATCCCDDADEDTDGCCKNERTVIQYKADYVVSPKTSSVKPGTVTLLFTISSFIFDKPSNTNTYYYFNCQSNPDYHSPPLYIKHGVFII
jgi:hypothetical protein